MKKGYISTHEYEKNINECNYGIEIIDFKYIQCIIQINTTKFIIFIYKVNGLIS